MKDLVKAMDRGYLSDEDKENIRRRQENFPLATRVWEESKLQVFDAKGDILKGVSGSTGSVLVLYEIQMNSTRCKRVIS